MRRLAALTFGVVVLLGCGLSTRSVDSDPIATYGQTPGPVMQAAVYGTLALVDGCLYVVPGTSGHRLNVLLPRSSYRWDNAKLVGPDKTYQVGDRFRAGGTVFGPSGLIRLDGVSIPRNCDSQDVGFLVQV